MVFKGLAGFSVSDLNIPGFRQPWEIDVGKPAHVASSLEIMLEAPIGCASFNNEFGRPVLAGYHRTLLTKIEAGNSEEEFRGYHKPIMLAGGVGTVRPQHSLKHPKSVSPGDYVIVLGGPSMVSLYGNSTASLGSQLTAHWTWRRIRLQSSRGVRRARLRIRTARQCRGSKKSPGGHQRLHEPGRYQSNPFHTRYWCRCVQNSLEKGII